MANKRFISLFLFSIFFSVFSFSLIEKVEAMVCAGYYNSGQISKNSSFSVTSANSGSYTHHFNVIGGSTGGSGPVTLHSYIKNSSGTTLSSLIISCTNFCNSSKDNLVNLSAGYYTITTEGFGGASNFYSGCADFYPPATPPPPPPPPPGATCGPAAKAYLATDVAFSGLKCSTGSSVPLIPTFPAQGGSTSWTCGTNSCTATRASGGGGGTTPLSYCGPAAKAYLGSETSYAGGKCRTSNIPPYDGSGSVSREIPWSVAVGGQGPYSASFPSYNGTSGWGCTDEGQNNNSTHYTFWCKATRGAAPVYPTLTVNLSPSMAAGYVYNANGTGSSDPNYPGCSIGCGVGNGGGTYNDCSKTCASGHNARLTIQAPINRTGYTWNGWSVNGGAIQNLTDLNITITANTNVTANWTASVVTTPGTCGPAATSYPSTTNSWGYIYTGYFCASGNPSPTSPTFPNAGGSVSWTCNSPDGGTNASCTASRATAAIVNSQCGTAQRAYTAAETAFSGTLCAVGNSYPTSGYWPTPGTYVPTFPTTGGSASWKCVGSTGSDATCTATRAAIVVPGPVTLAVTSCVNSSVRISWGAVPSAWSYAVYRNGSLIGQTTNLYQDIPSVSPSDIFRVTSLVGYTPIVETALTPDVYIPPGTTAGTVSGTDYPTKAQAGLNASHPSPSGNPAIPVISGVDIYNSSNPGGLLTATSSYYLRGTADVQSQSSKILHLDYYTMPDESSSWTLKDSEDINTGYVLGGVNQVNRRGQFSLGPFTNSIVSGHDLFYYINAYQKCIVDYKAEHSWQSGFKNFNIGSSLVGVCGTAIGTYPFAASNFSGSLCSAGIASPLTPTFPLAGGSVSWNCVEAGGGTSGTCTVTHLAETGACNPAAARNYSSAETSFTFPLCSGGTPIPATPAFPVAGNSATWQCGSGGTGPICTATRSAPSALHCDSLHLSNPLNSPLVNLYVLTTWEVIPAPGPGVTVNWTVTDANGTTHPPQGTSLNKTFTTIGLKTVTAQMASSSNTSITGDICTATTSITQQGGDNREN